MKIEKGLPPNYEQIKAAFPQVEDLHVVFTYGDTIFNPRREEVSDHLFVHESVHEIQQGDDPEGWWTRYIEDVHFRISQEVEAYAHQYLFIKGRCSNSVTKDFLFSIASDLAGPIYGNILSYAEAETAIRRKAKELGTTALTA